MSNKYSADGGLTHIETVPTNNPLVKVDLYQVNLTGEYGGSCTTLGIHGVRADSPQAAFDEVMRIANGGKP